MNPFIERWATAVNEGELADILDQYAESASLMGTVEDAVLFGRAQLLMYFSELLQRDSLQCYFEEIEEVCPNVWIGIYVFEWDDGQLPVRFTFVVGEGGIEHHHSSSFPSMCGV